MSQSDSDQDFIDYLKQQQLPFIVLNRQLEDKSIVNISADDAAGVETAIDYAIDQGHRKIAYIGGIEGFRSASERKAGLLRSLTKHHLPINESYFFEGDYSIEGGFQEMKKILSLKDLPTLVFCANDDMAIGAIRAAEENGLQIPKDISFIGFDDSPFVAYLNPPLTTVHKPIYKISQQGTELLLSMIAKLPITKQQVKVPTHLEIRKSVAALAPESDSLE